MATIKTYNGSTWENAVVRKYGTASEIITLPTTIYADGTAITSYTLKGNTVQNGTPTPSNPVDVNGVGVRTENLYNNTYYIQNANRNHCTVETLTTGFKLISNGGDTYLGSAGKSPDTASSTAINSSIEVKPETKYTLHLSSSPWCFVSYIGTDGTYLNSSYINIPQRYVPIDYTFTTPANCKYVLFRLGSGVVESGDETSITDIMLVEGETAPTSYIPWGYKIPILTAQGSAVNYLGSVQSTRQVKKLVLTGTETWNKSSSSNPDDYLYHTDIGESQQGAISDCICTHEPYLVQYPTGDTQGCTFKNYLTGYRLIYINVGSAIMNAQPSGNTINGFKEYLQAQYANGTPVTVWYVLATEETGIVNEPLMKIGTYTDTLSNAASIPTTDGANSITVDTTVQPSEFSATWTGWHNASVKEYDGSDWQ